MRFSHLLMCLPLETLTSIIGTGLPILVKLIDLVNSDFIQVINFPTRIPDCDSHSPASAAASEFCEWVKVRIDVYIPH